MWMLMRHLTIITTITISVITNKHGTWPVNEWTLYCSPFTSSITNNQSRSTVGKFDGHQCAVSASLVMMCGQFFLYFIFDRYYPLMFIVVKLYLLK